MPGPLVVVIGGTAASWLFGFAQQGVAVIGTIPTGLPSPAVWSSSLGDLNALLPAAVTVALVQFMKDVSLGRRFRDRSRFEQAARLKDIMILRVDTSFSFANAEYLQTFILQKSEHEDRPVKAVVLDGSSINGLDATATDALFTVAERLEETGIELHLAGLIGPVRETVRRSGLHALLGEKRFHLTPHEAVATILDRLDAEEDTRRLEEYLETAGPEEKDPTPAAT